MSEQELRDGLQVAVADEPPMTFDLDELVSTAERLMRRRRALIAVGAGTAAVAVVAVTIPVILGIARSEPQELPVAAPPSSVAVQPSGSPTEQLRARSEQIRTHLTSAFPAAVPGVTDVDVRPLGGEAEGQIFDGQNYLSGTIKYTLAGQRSAVIIEIHSPNDTAPAKQDCADCTLRTQPDGTNVTVRTEQVGQAAGDKSITATHARADKSIVTVTTYTYDPTGGTHGVSPLTLDQIVSLAADPGLHL